MYNGAEAFGMFFGLFGLLYFLFTLFIVVLSIVFIFKTMAFMKQKNADDQVRNDQLKQLIQLQNQKETGSE